jgi:hypothetical protein
VTATPNQLRDAIRPAICTAFSVGNTGARFIGAAIGGLRRLLGGGSEPVGYPFNQARQSVANFCNQLPRQPDEAPITGGQCVGILYEVRVTVDSYINGVFASKIVDQSMQGVVPGPVTSVRIRQPDMLTVEAYNPSGLQATLFLGTSPNQTYKNLTNARVVRIDGQPDNCGDPPPLYPPWNPGVDIIPINIDGRVYALALGIAVLNLNGELNVDFSIEDPEFTLEGNINFDIGEINFGSPGSAIPGNCDPPIVFTPPGAAPDDPPEPPNSFPFVGVHLRIIPGSPNPRTSVFPYGEIGPTLYIPRLVSVSFLIKAGSLLSWSEPQDAKFRNSWIEVPGKFFALDYRLYAPQDLEISVYPAYLPVEVQN